MIPWATIVSAGAQMYGGIKSAINNKQQQADADAEAARQKAFYEAEAAANPLSRSENQYLLGKYDREAKEAVERARSVGKITGATPEYGLAVQKGVAAGRADLMGQMSAGASQRADRFKIAGEMSAHQKAIDDQQRLAARQQTYASLVQNASTAFGNMMAAYQPQPLPEAPITSVKPDVRGVQVGAAPAGDGTLQENAAAAAARGLEKLRQSVL